MTTRTTKTPPTTPRPATGRGLEIDMAGLPIVLDADAIMRVTGSLWSRKTVERMLRSQEIPSFLLRSRRVTRREDLCAALAKMARTAA